MTYSDFFTVTFVASLIVCITSHIDSVYRLLLDTGPINYGQVDQKSLGAPDHPGRIRLSSRCQHQWFLLAKVLLRLPHHKFRFLRAAHSDTSNHKFTARPTWSGLGMAITDIYNMLDS